MSSIKDWNIGDIVAKRLIAAGDKADRISNTFFGSSVVSCLAAMWLDSPWLLLASFVLMLLTAISAHYAAGLYKGAVEELQSYIGRKVME